MLLIGVCACVRACIKHSLCAKLQLMSLTNPSCNSDISAPVLAGEGGEVCGWWGRGAYLMHSQPFEELWRSLFFHMFTKLNEALGSGGDPRVEDDVDVSLLSCIYNDKEVGYF